MSKKVQLILNEESSAILSKLTKEANENFNGGSINMSDVMNEVLLFSKIDIRLLQSKHTNIRKSLRQLSTLKDIDIDLAIKNLMELKAGTAKKISKSNSTKGEELDNSNKEKEMRQRDTSHLKGS